MAAQAGAFARHGHENRLDLGTDVFLDSAPSYQLAQQLAGSERLAVSEQTLRHRLHQNGLLASVDEGRGMLPVRRILEASATSTAFPSELSVAGPQKQRVNL